MVIDKSYKLNHIELSVLENKEAASSETVFLALHGWLDNAASFEKIIKCFPDLPWCSMDFSGHGFSEHRPAGCFYHLWDYVLDVVQLIDQIGSNVCLVGHSMGGAVAMLVAAIAPEKVSALIVLDNTGPLTIEKTERVSRLQKSIRSMNKVQNKRKHQYSSLDDMIQARMQGFTPLSYQAAKALVLRGSQLDVDNWYRWQHDPKLWLATPFPMDKASVDAFTAQIHCPTLLLFARKGIYQNNETLVDQRVKSISKKTIKWLEGSHHFHLEEDTYLDVCNEIKAFITQNKIQ